MENTTAASPASSSSSIEDCEAAILTHLSESETALIDDTYPWSKSLRLDHDKVVGAIKSLLVDAYIEVEDVTSQFWLLESEGSQVVKDGSPEARVFHLVHSKPSQSASLSEIQAELGQDVAKIGMGNCMKLKWIQKSKENPQLLVTCVDSIQDQVQQQLADLQTKGFALQALDDKVREKN
jgi:phenylalanyl-tRNA synthetase alpha chain